MSDYRMDITGDIGLMDYSNIYDYINIVDNKDSFLITIDTSSIDSIKIVESILTDKNFTIINSGYDETGKYFVSANKSR